MTMWDGTNDDLRWVCACVHVCQCDHHVHGQQAAATFLILSIHTSSLPVCRHPHPWAKGPSIML
eukprot:6491378-Amphidinium_carterae.1